MTRFKTKPVEIEAIKFTGDNVNEIWDTFGVVGIYGPTEKNPDYLILTTADGNEIPCSSGMWVMKDSKPNTFYPCNDEHFQMKYEAVDETEHLLESEENASRLDQSLGEAREQNYEKILSEDELKD